MSFWCCTNLSFWPHQRSLDVQQLAVHCRIVFTFESTPFPCIQRMSRAYSRNFAVGKDDNLLLQLVDDMLLVWNMDRAQELVKKAIDKHAKYTSTELDRSRPVKKGAATRK